MSLNKKAENAANARIKYDRNKEGEQKRKLIYRIQKGATPTITSMKKHGLTLEEVNEIRKSVDMPKLRPDELLGYTREKFSMELNKPEDVVKSIVKNVHVFEKHDTEQKVNMVKIDKDSKITLDIYFECLSDKLVPNTIKMYRRYIQQILTTMGWKEDESIVPYLKQYKRVEKIIPELKQTRGPKKGKAYGDSSIKVMYQAISSGMWNDACPEFESQMGPEAKKFYNDMQAKYNADDQTDRITRNVNATYTDFEVIKKKALEFVNNKKADVEERALIGIYTLFGGIPRTKQYLNVHVVDNIQEADDKNKNYYVKSTHQLISNDHKTGVDNNKKGKAAILDLTGNKTILRLVDLLAGEYDILFEYDNRYMNDLFKTVLGETNRKIRHSFSTYVTQKDDIELIGKASEISAHSIKTMRTLYANPQKKETKKKKK